MDVPAAVPPSITASSTQPNEQILRLMQSLGIDSSKTREVKFLLFLNREILFYFSSIL